MNKTQLKKKKIFEHYSTNLNWIKEKTNVKFKIEFERGILCPICLDIFLENQLEISSENYLTLEHNPPDSLGGKANILTCKSCNNKLGHKCDVALLNYLLDQDFKNFKPNSKHRTILKNPKGDKVTAIINWDNDGKLIIDVKGKHSNPKDLKNIIESEEKGIFPNENDPYSFFTSKWNFEFESPNKGDMRLASIALLKIGYLLAFEKFGHIFLFNKNLDIIRKQILNPDENIIKDPFWINYNFPENLLGMSIIEKPKKLNAFVSTFKLVTPSGSPQISIVLPKYGENDYEIYQNMRKEFLTDIDIRITTLEPFLDLKDINKVFYPFHLPFEKE